ncbi:hypothetical protein L208DRAFT_1425949 [Tricholoma matsutake]|nr:hypothetical protein L208DRAFT_1425949 [Tricholoma matsutake 945]
MTSSNSSRDQVKHSDPIAINTTSRRGRSFSLSSCSSLSSESSASEAHTPSPTSLNSQRITVPSPSGSPILSYFLGQSPTKNPGTSTFPFNRKFGPSPVLEEEQEIPAATHARRASAVVAGRFAQSQTQPLPDPHVERGTAFLRRLSLSSGPFAKPLNEGTDPPPNSAVSPVSTSKLSLRDTKPRRSATVNEGGKPRRAPSPMGERILKGHFDGFN